MKFLLIIVLVSTWNICLSLYDEQDQGRSSIPKEGQVNQTFPTTYESTLLRAPRSDDLVRNQQNEDKQILVEAGRIITDEVLRQMRRIEGHLTQLRIKCPPPRSFEPILVGETVHVEGQEGESATLECQSATHILLIRDPSLDYRDVSVTWFKGSKPLRHSQNKSEILIQENQWGTLIIQRLLTNDSGLYTCRSTFMHDLDSSLPAHFVDSKVFVKVNASSESSMTTELSTHDKVHASSEIYRICGTPITANSSMETNQEIDEPDSRIVGGRAANKGAFPWQAMLWGKATNIETALCGGSVLSEKWIVTAAHCFDGIPESWYMNYTVKLGKHDKSIDEESQIVTRINEVIKHPGYKKKARYNNDIALVRVTNPIQFTDYIRPICLGNISELEHTFFEKSQQLGYVSGWGYLNDKGPQPNILQEIQLPIQEYGTCRNSTVPRYVTDNMFCAGYPEGNADACTGDSGGPFVGEHKGRWYLLGIVSWGEGCARKGKYGFYTRVLNYHDWIRDTLFNYN